MSQPAQQINIDDDVSVLTEVIDELKQLAAKTDVEDDEIYDVSIRWGTALSGRLPRLVHYSARKSLTPADQHRFESLCEQLNALSDLIERFGLTHPVFADTPTDHKIKRVNLLRQRLGLK